MKASHFNFLSSVISVKIGTAQDVTYFHDDEQTDVRSVAWLQKEDGNLTHAIELTQEGELLLATHKDYAIAEELYIWFHGIASLHDLKVEEQTIAHDEDEETTESQSQTVTTITNKALH